MSILFPQPTGSWPVTRICKTEGCGRNGLPTNVTVPVVDGAIVLPTLVCTACFKPMGMAEWSQV